MGREPMSSRVIGVDLASNRVRCFQTYQACCSSDVSAVMARADRLVR
jgi:hypothetical protein